MDNSPLTQLMLTGRHYKRAKGQVVQSFDDTAAVKLLKTGYVKRYLISKDGSLGVQSIYGPGYFFPLTAALMSLLNQKIYHGAETYYYEAITNAEVYSLSLEALKAAAKADPLIYRDVLFESGKRLESNIQQLENMALRQPGMRVAHELVYLARQFGEVTPSGTKLAMPLTHQDLSDILSLSRETVSRAIIKLREDGLLGAGSRIEIPDIDRLVASYTQS